MSTLKIKAGDWVVVCDGRKAIILDNVGDERFPSLHVKEVREHDDLRTSEQGTDEPGVAFSSVGEARSAVEQTDWHDQGEQSFLHRLAHDLHAAVVGGTVEGLVVVAPPRALGMIRQAWPSTHRDAIKAELAQDYVKLPVDEIERRLFK